MVGREERGRSLEAIYLPILPATLCAASASAAVNGFLMRYGLAGESVRSRAGSAPTESSAALIL